MWKTVTALACALVLSQAGVLALSDQEMLYLFEDCVMFNSSSKYGGPVCGSNGATYPNSLYVRCMNYKLPKNECVWVRHSGACTSSSHHCPYSHYYRPVCASDNNTYANMEALSCKASYDDPHVCFVKEGPCQCPHLCARADRSRENGGPVCATNGVTYPNINEILCLRKYNEELNVLHDGGCSVYDSRRAMISHHHTCSLAKNRYEWNPMCGADNVTYPNMFVLKCFNPSLPVLFASECGSAIHKACTAAAQDPKGNSVEGSEEVCGSDGATYPTANHLLCASNFNKHLQRRHAGACTKDDDPCKVPPLSGPGRPVCGSDGQTYVTPEAMWCVAANHRPNLKYVHDGPCLPPRGIPCVLECKM